MAWPVSPSTRTAASRALSFFALGAWTGGVSTCGVSDPSAGVGVPFGGDCAIGVVGISLSSATTGSAVVGVWAGTASVLAALFLRVFLIGSDVAGVTVFFLAVMRHLLKLWV